jgi:hypothetical protein
LDFGFEVLELSPIYVTLEELCVSKMFGDVHDRLTLLCRQYNPGSKFVLNVGIGARWNRTFNTNLEPGLY